MNVNGHRRVTDIRWNIAVEIALFHAAVFERDCSLRHDLRHSERNTGLELGFDRKRINGNARINRDGHPMYFWPLVFNGDVHSTSDARSERFMARNTEGMPLRQAAAPGSALLVHQIERPV